MDLSQIGPRPLGNFPQYPPAIISESEAATARESPVTIGCEYAGRPSKEAAAGHCSTRAFHERVPSVFSGLTFEGRRMIASETSRRISLNVPPEATAFLRIFPFLLADLLHGYGAAMVASM